MTSPAPAQLKSRRSVLPRILSDTQANEAHNGPADVRPRVLHIARSAAADSCGVGAIVRALVAEQNDKGVSSQCWSVATSESLQAAATADAIPVEYFRGFPVVGPRRLAFSRELLREVTSVDASGYGIIHQHGMWSAASLATARWRERFNRPTVIAPHGTLDPWALRQSWAKKRLSYYGWERRNLHKAACLHATGEQEVAAFRDFGLSNPIALIPNGVSQHWINSQGNAADFRNRFQIPNDRRVLLYLSRVTPKKGLSMLLEAMNKDQTWSSDWILVIAGPDERGYTAQLRAQCQSLGLEGHVVFVGPIYGKDRRDALDAAELFVLPTHSEGNPMAVLEALAVGLPVLTTTGTPCPFIETEGMGWRTSPSVEGLSFAMQEALSLPKDALRERGRTGRDYMQKHGTWRHAQSLLSQLYQWLLGANSKPDFVVDD